MATQNEALEMKEKLAALARAAEEYGTQAEQLAKSNDEMLSCVTEMNKLAFSLKETAKKCDEYIDATNQYLDSTIKAEFSAVVKEATIAITNAQTNLDLILSKVDASFTSHINEFKSDMIKQIKSTNELISQASKKVDSQISLSKQNKTELEKVINGNINELKDSINSISTILSEGIKQITNIQNESKTEINNLMVNEIASIMEKIDICFTEEKERQAKNMKKIAIYGGISFAVLLILAIIGLLL